MIGLTKLNGGKVFVDPASIVLVETDSDNDTVVSGKGFEAIYVSESVKEVLEARNEYLFHPFVDEDEETLSLQLDRANEMIVDLVDKLSLYERVVLKIEASLEKFFNGKATHFMNSNELSRDVVEAIASLDEGLEEFGEDE